MTLQVWNIHSSNPETAFTLMDAYSLDYIFTDSHRPLQLVNCDKQAGCACVRMASSCMCKHNNYPNADAQKNNYPMLFLFLFSLFKQIWDLQTRKRVHRLAMHDTSMGIVACHPKLPLLVTTWKRTLCLWDANTYR